MQLDREDLPSWEDPDDPDHEDENEIMAELRMIREAMRVEFPTDEALFRAMQAHEAEMIAKKSSSS